MRVPRDLDGSTLVRRLRKLGYEQTRQSGSHVRLTHNAPDGDHHVTIPLHSPMRVGTLNAILADVAAHLGMSKDDLIRLVS